MPRIDKLLIRAQPSPAKHAQIANCLDAKNYGAVINSLFPGSQALSLAEEAASADILIDEL
jgi:hypothetical protein